MTNRDIIDQRVLFFRKWCDKSGLQQKEHQISGMRFCLKREFKKSSFGIRGGIVADEMGLGKTILMLGCIVANYRFVKFCKSKCRNTLIVVPRALISQWAEIIDKLFNKKLKTNIFHGTNVKNITIPDLENGAITITTYGMLSHKIIQGICWKRVVFDEAHHLRNSKSKKHCCGISVNAKIKWLLSGTPINNRVNDLESLCKILLGYKRSRIYKNYYDEVVSKHILKRTKKGIGINLPPINTTIINVDWEYPDEKKLAVQIHNNINFSDITSNIKTGCIIRDMTKTQLGCFIRARQICIVPTPIIKTMRIKMSMRDEGLMRDEDLMRDEGLMRDEDLMREEDLMRDEGELMRCNTSSKLDAVVSHITNSFNTHNLKANSRKLVFCHYLDEIDYIYTYFKNKGVSIGKITGKTSEKERKDLFSPFIGYGDIVTLSKKFRNINGSKVYTDIFNLISDFGGPRILLVQIQTGCEGLNLQHFKDIYFTSPHWNPSVEDQAVARSHRIGQNSPVNVYKFIMNDLCSPNTSHPPSTDYGDKDIGYTMDKYCLYVQNKKRELMECLDKYETDKNGSYLL
jgi:SNF2 family DNA or RNA helicase